MVKMTPIEQVSFYFQKNPETRKIKSSSGAIYKNHGNGNISCTIAKPNGRGIKTEYVNCKLKSLLEQTKRGCFSILPDGSVRGITENGKFAGNIHGDYICFFDKEDKMVSKVENNKPLIDGIINFIRHGSSNKISIKTAEEFFAKNPSTREFVPPQEFLNTQVKFIKKEDGTIQKIVTRLDTKKSYIGIYINGQAAPKGYVYIDSIKPLDDKKISVSYIQNGEKKLTTLPKYLYHFTSPEAEKGIRSSGQLDISKNEQLKGLFLIDGENLVSNYKNVKIKDGEEKDLLTGIFVQATKNKNIKDGKVVIFRIPTESLLKEGKVRIRRQEDFFRIQMNKLLPLYEALKKKGADKIDCRVRDLANDETRMKFRELVIKNKLMSEQEIDALIEDMTQKLHHGYNITRSEDFTRDYALEYIYNRKISTADFARMGIKTRTLEINNFMCKDGTIDPQKLKQIF